MTAARTTMSGLEYMRRIVAGEIEASPMERLLNIRITSVEEGLVTVTAEPALEFENGLRIAHGGFAATLLDTALGCAVNSVMPAGKIFTTLEMKINFTHAVTRPRRHAADRHADLHRERGARGLANRDGGRAHRRRAWKDLRARHGHVHSLSRHDGGFMNEAVIVAGLRTAVGKAPRAPRSFTSPGCAALSQSPSSWSRFPHRRRIGS